MTQREQRRAQRTLACSECHYYSISQQCYYGWMRRYEPDGLQGLKDRSSRPQHSPAPRPAEVVQKVVGLRKHYPFTSGQNRDWDLLIGPPGLSRS